MGFRARFSALVALMLSSQAVAATIAYETGELLVTSDANSTAAGTATYVQNLAFADGRLFVVYADCVGADSCVDGDPIADVYLKAYVLQSGSFESRVKVFDRTDSYATSYTHELPAIIAQGTTLHVFNPDVVGEGAGAGSCDDAAGTDDAYCTRSTTNGCNDDSGEAPPYYASVPVSTYGTRGTWTPSGTTPGDTTCAASSWALSGATYDPTVIDVQGLTLPNGTLIWHGENSRIDSGDAGLSCWIARRTSGGTVSGPYTLVRASTYTGQSSSGSCTAYAGRNVFSKCKIRERGGVLHLVWAPIKNADYGPVKHAYEIFYAKSTDSGVTWTSIDGSASWTPGATGGTTSDEAIAHDDQRFKVYTGDYAPHTEHGFDVDSDGHPAIIVRYLHSVPGPTCKDPEGVERADNDDTSESGPVYHMKMIRYDGTAWRSVEIDDEIDWQTKYPVLFIDSRDRYWIFKPGTIDHPEVEGMAYKESDDGETFGEWTPLLQDVHDGTTPNNEYRPDRLVSIWDTNREWIAFSYKNFATDEMYLKYIELVGPREQDSRESVIGSGGGGRSFVAPF